MKADGISVPSEFLTEPKIQLSNPANRHLHVSLALTCSSTLFVNSPFHFCCHCNYPIQVAKFVYCVVCIKTVRTAYTTELSSATHKSNRK